MLRRLMRFFKELSRMASMLGAKSIARRMFVTNAFDGLLSALGVSMGLFIAGETNPASYIGGVAGSAVVMGFFSGFVATYLSERAERLRELRETERVLLHSLEGSVYWRAARLVPLYVAFWSSIGAVFLPLLAAIPFVLAYITGVPVEASTVYISAGMSLAMMYSLGFYLGKVSGENPWANGARFAGIGALALVTLSLVSLVW